MLPLRDLQHAIRAAMLGGGGVGAAAESVIAGDGLTPAARLGIYRHHVFASLTEALTATFPVVCRLVDERFFAYLADSYIRVNPPIGPCLFEYGATFAEFLRRFPPCQGLPYLPDVARLEWAMNLARHAGDADALDPVALRGIPEADVADLRFRLRPSVSLIWSPWPIDRIWRTNQPDGDPESIVDLGAGEACLEVRRDGDDVVYRTLDPAVWVFRQALGEGQSLGEATEAAQAADPKFDLAAALRRLLSDEVLVGVDRPARDKEVNRCRPESRTAIP